MTGRAAVYTRISSDREGRELGVARQREDCLNLARRRDLQVRDGHVFEENDTGASTHSQKRRPRYAAMLAAARAGEFDVVVAYSNSRLTRRPREYEDLIALHEQTGVRIYTVASGDIDLSTANGRMLARVLAASDANEAEQTAERVQRAARQRAERGEWHGGSVPYGYRPTTAAVPATPATDSEPARPRVPARGPLVLDEREAGLVREAASRLLAGDTLYGVTKDWNARGVATGRVGTKPRLDGSEVSQHWRQGNVRAKLLNKALLGGPGREAVLDAQTFARVEALLRDPSRNVAHSPGVKSTKYTMAGGLSVCGTCGHRLISNVHRGRAILFCSKAYSGEGACGSNRVEHDALERYVLDLTVGKVQENPRWLQRNSEPDPERERRVQALDAEAQTLRDRRARVLDMYEEGLLDKAERAWRLAPLTEGLARVQAQLDSALGEAQALDVVAGGLEWRAWSPAKRRTFLRLAWGTITVLPGRLTPPRRLGAEGDEAFEERRRAYVAGQVAGRVGLSD